MQYALYNEVMKNEGLLNLLGEVGFFWLLDQIYKMI